MQSLQGRADIAGDVEYPALLFSIQDGGLGDGTRCGPVGGRVPTLYGHRLADVHYLGYAIAATHSGVRTGSNPHPNAAGLIVWQLSAFHLLGDPDAFGVPVSAGLFELASSCLSPQSSSTCLFDRKSRVTTLDSELEKAVVQMPVHWIRL